MTRHAIILDIRQAKQFADANHVVDAVISFCPTASYFLKERGFTILSTADYYGAEAHGDVVITIADKLPKLVKAAATQYSLVSVEEEGLSVYLYHYLCCVYHFHFALTQFSSPSNSFTWWEGDRFHEGGYNTMFASIAKTPSPVILAYAYTGYSQAHAWLASFYNSIIYYLARRTPHLKIIDYGDELSKRIIQAVIDNGDKPLVFHTHTVCKRPYKTTRFFIKSIARILLGKADGKPAYVFRVAKPAQYKNVVKPFEISAMRATEVKQAVGQAVTEFIPFIRTEVAMGRNIIERLKPQIAVSDHAKYGYILSGLQAMNRYGGKHAMLNHGTHTIQYEEISKTAAMLWGAQQRVINKHTTHSLPKSPLTASLVRELRADDGYTIYPINVYGRVNHQPSPTGKFVILQAGNYTDAYNHIPWCKETADEYLLAIIELIEEVGKLENVDLIIKLKNKKADTHKKIVEEHIAKLGVGDKVRVDTTSKFSDLMGKAHLIACNLSGTLEEALANRIPLMVHTYRKHYFHIAPETLDACTQNGLAPAYLVKQRSDIAVIISKLTVRRAELNEPRLYNNVTWQDGQLIDMRRFAEELVKGVAP